MLNTADGNPVVARSIRDSILVAAILLVALSLRPSIASVGPLLQQIGDELRIGETALGFLGAIPLLAFGLVSPLVNQLSRRFGIELTLLISLVTLSAAILARSFLGDGGLWLGTVAMGAAIAIGNVLVPVIVRRDYPTRISWATAVYSAIMAIGAAAGSAFAVPVAEVAGWRVSLAIWAGPMLIIAVIWLARMRFGPRSAASALPPAHARVSVWRQPTAWLVTAMMAVQSTTFYILLTWLPSIELGLGIDARTAGFHLFLFLALGSAAGLLMPFLMRGPDQTVAAVVTASLTLLAALGIVLLPGLVLLWVIVAAVGSASLVVALALISLRGRTEDEAVRLSGMAQSVGYLFAAAGPVGAGLLYEALGGWEAPLIAVAVLAAIQIVIGIAVGKDRRPVVESAGLSD